MAAEYRKALAKRLQKQFQGAVENDSWGQVVEAEEAYRSLARSLEETTSSRNLSAGIREAISKVIGVILARLDALASGEDTVTYDDVKTASTYLVATLDGKTVEEDVEERLTQLAGNAAIMATPKHLRTTRLRGNSGSGDGTENDDSGSHAAAFDTEQGSLLPQALSDGKSTFVSITIDKIGFKKVTKFIDTTITVTVFARGGSPIGPPQETPPSNEKDGQHIKFGDIVHIQNSYESLCAANEPAILLEAKHLKSKKGKQSTFAWAFLEMDELSEGEKTLELYEKPADPKRKRIRLLSTKKLFLHVTVGRNEGAEGEY